MTSPARPSSSVMDTTGLLQVGKFGKLSLLKSVSPKQLQLQGSSKAPSGGANSVVTSFGIDDEEFTFGRDPKCGVRLYYPDVALVHCKIVHEDRKAFLTVIGESGLIVDGCEVFPKKMSDGRLMPTTVPLSNYSEFVIHGKRFSFEYPPKNMRAELFAAPSPKTNRKLRLSMIQSAQVFSPRPSHDPRENLRILQSPLKNQFRSPSKPSSLGKSPYNGPGSPTPQRGAPSQQEPDSDEDEEEEIVLVDGNHPRVVQEDRDLVILEDVQEDDDEEEEEEPRAPAKQIQPSPYNALQHRQMKQATVQSPPPRTPPRRKSMGRNTLHRAVLIRSAQRAVMRAEEEEEEREVLETVVGEEADSDEDELGGEVDEEDDYEKYGYGGELQPPQSQSQSQSQEDSDDAMDVDSASEEEEEYEEEVRDDKDTRNARGANDKPLWRKSLERLWPFNSGEQEPSKEPGSESESDEEPELPPPRTKPQQVQEDEVSEEEDADEEEPQNAPSSEPQEEEVEDEEEEEDRAAPLPVLQTPARRTLGSFLTPQFKPQPQSNNLFGGRTPTAAPSTTATGGGNPASGAPGRFSLGGVEARRVLVEQPWRVKDIVVPSTPGSNPGHASSSTSTAGPSQAPQDTPRRMGQPRVTSEERRAIQERRRSALREPDNFFVGGVPGSGLSPVKTKPRYSAFGISSPIKPSIPFATLAARASTSPDKAGGAEGDEDGDLGRRRSSAEEDEMDTKVLLEKMKETVEVMKRRKSVAATPAATPMKPLYQQEEPHATPMGQAQQAKTPGVQKSVKKLYLEPTFADRDGREESEQEPVSGLAPLPALSFDVEMKGASSSEGEAAGDEEGEKDEEDASFSLLRPAARKSLGLGTLGTPRRSPIPVIVEPAPQPQPVVEKESEAEAQMEVDTEKEIVEEAQQEEEAPKTRGRTRGTTPVASTSSAATEPSAEKPPSRSKPPSSRGAATRRTRSGSVAEAASTEQEPAPVTDSLQVEHPVRSTRSRSRSASREPAASTKPTRRPKTPVEEVIPEETSFVIDVAVDDDDDEPPLPPPRKTRATTPKARATATAKAKAPASKEKAKPKSKLTTPAPVAKRKGKAPAQPVEENDEDDDEMDIVGDDDDASAEVVAEEGDEPVAPKRGRAKAAATTTVPAAKRATSAGSAGRKTPTEPPAKSRLKAPTTSRTRKAAAATEDTPVAVKDEEDEAEASTSKKPTGTSRTKPSSGLKTPAPVASRSRSTRGTVSASNSTSSVGSSSGAPATTTATTRVGRAGVKTPATAPAAVNVQQKQNKENEDSETVLTKIKMSRSRTTRTTTATASGSGASGSGGSGPAAAGSSTAKAKRSVKVKDEEEEVGVEEPAAPARTRVMRSSRARTKTG